MSRRLPHQVAVETERPTLPPNCICCGEAAEMTYTPTQPQRPRGIPEPESPLTLPYCKTCHEHLRRWQRRAGDRLVVANLFIWGIAIPLAASLPLLTMVIGPALALATVVRSSRDGAPEMKPQCSTEGTSCRVEWYRRSTYVFSFTNENVATRFRDANLAVLTEGNEWRDGASR